MAVNQILKYSSNNSSTIPETKMVTLNILPRAIVYSLSILLHALNNIIIIRHRLLHKPKYCLLINLSTCDIVGMVSAFLWYIFQPHLRAADVCLSIAANGSVLTTVAITIDRYIAVVYCLRYHEIVNRRKVAISILVIWSIALVLTGVPEICTSDAKLRRVIHDGLVHPLHVLFCVFLISAAFWIRRIRNVHMKTIRKRQVYFGVVDERLHVLQNLAATVLDVIKLNLATSIFIILGNMLYIFHYLGDYFDTETITMVRAAGLIFWWLYILSHPLVYILSMTELKQVYINLFKLVTSKCRRKRVMPINNFREIVGQTEA